MPLKRDSFARTGKIEEVSRQGYEAIADMFRSRLCFDEGAMRQAIKWNPDLFIPNIRFYKGQDSRIGLSYSSQGHNVFYWVFASSENLANKLSEAIKGVALQNRPWRN